MDLCNRENTLARHAPSPPNDDESTSPLPPEPGCDRTRSAIANRTAPLPSVAPVSDLEVSPSAPANKAWNSSSVSCLAPSSSLSHVRLLKSRKVCHAPDIFRPLFFLFFPLLQDIKTFSSDYDHQNIGTPLLLQIPSDYKGI